MAVPAKKINITVLISPLDWGLGHATRCIPIIRILVQKRCRLIIAGSGFHQKLLQLEFPQLEYIHLDGYGIRYGKHSVMIRLVLQLPHFFRNVRRENKWLREIINNYQVDAVISDNRYGLSTPMVPCVFVTHQLQVKAPSLFKFAERFTRKRIYKFINRFTECWVPDLADKNNSLAGSLSHPDLAPAIPVRYIGWLSRFEKAAASKKGYMVTISLSGPEPQRTLLEDIILPQLKNVPGTILLLRGMPGETFLPVVPAHVTVFNHLAAAEMQEAFLQSEYVICRSGYSSLMDMQVLQCKCIFIPTPGQTEQEYLGKRLADKKMAIVKKQKDFNLSDVLREAIAFQFPVFDNYRNDVLENVITKWLQSLHKTYHTR